VWYVFEGAVEPWNPKPIPKFETLNVECGMCLKMQWNHETPNQSRPWSNEGACGYCYYYWEPMSCTKANSVSQEGWSSSTQAFRRDDRGPEPHSSLLWQLCHFPKGPRVFWRSRLCWHDYTRVDCICLWGRSQKTRYTELSGIEGVEDLS